MTALFSCARPVPRGASLSTSESTSRPGGLARSGAIAALRLSPRTAENSAPSNMEGAGSHHLAIEVVWPTSMCENSRSTYVGGALVRP